MAEQKQQVTFTFKPAPAHLGEDTRTAYSGEADGLPTPPGFKPSRWVGTVYPCPMWAPKALCIVDGKHCEGWHGSTFTGQLPDCPEFYTHGKVSRVETARALYDQRVRWAEQRERSVNDARR